MKIRCRSCDQLVESSEEWGSGSFICPQCRGSQAADAPAAKQPSGVVLTGDQQQLLANYQRASTGIGALMLIMGAVFAIVMPIAAMTIISSTAWGIATLQITVLLVLCAGFLVMGYLSVQRRPGVHKVNGPFGLLMTLGELLRLPTILAGDLSKVVGELAVVVVVLAIGIGGIYCTVQVRKLKKAGIDPRMKRGT
jgi:hypothetical protein